MRESFTSSLHCNEVDMDLLTFSAAYSLKQQVQGDEEDGAGKRHLG